MKVLIVHNRYRPAAPSGEDAVVDQESAALSDRGHDVALFQRHSEEIAGWSPLRRATLPVRLLWSQDSRRSIADLLDQFAPEIVVFRDLNEPRLTRELQHPDRIVIRPIPKLRIEVPEETARGRFPGPPDVEDHLAQWLERRRELRDDVVSVIRRHVAEFRKRGGDCDRKSGSGKCSGGAPELCGLASIRRKKETERYACDQPAKVRRHADLRRVKIERCLQRDD